MQLRDGQRAQGGRARKHSMCLHHEQAMIAWPAVIISRPAFRSIQFRSVSVRRRVHLHRIRERQANTAHSARDEDKFDSIQRPVHTRVNNGQPAYSITRNYIVNMNTAGSTKIYTQGDIGVIASYHIYASYFSAIMWGTRIRSVVGVIK